MLQEERETQKERKRERETQREREGERKKERATIPTGSATSTGVDPTATAAPEKPTKELNETDINNDIDMFVRLVIVFGGLTMSMVRKNLDEGLGESLKNLTSSQKNDELLHNYNFKLSALCQSLTVTS
ncbi:hypothetical protein Taro_029542 [Colocasia esculenta]|uniref:Uncharacterized protein n=1 Tax=Colocasia esculenta TaxID=4460 RepID=A0A843VE27_COLES|nr:hypothetical protein [Colocasia esculenta]